MSTVQYALVFRTNQSDGRTSQDSALGLHKCNVLTSQRLPVLSSFATAISPAPLSFLCLGNMVNSWGLLTFVVWAAMTAVNPASCDAHGRRLDPHGYTDSSLNVHEARSSVPPGFVNTGPAPADETLKLRFALAQSTPDAIVDTLYKVSDPKSPQYGQHLSKSEVSNFDSHTHRVIDHLRTGREARRA